MGLYMYVQNPAIELFEDEDLMVIDNCKNTPPNGSVEFRNPLGFGYKYNWTGPNGFTSSSQDISGLSSGEYCVEVRKISDPECIYAKGCVSVGVSFGPPIALVDKQNLPFCKGNEGQWSCKGSLTIDVHNGATVEWLNIPNLNETFNTTVTDLCANTYTVEVCLDGCCTRESFTLECCVHIGNDGEEENYIEPIILSGQVNSNNGSIILTVNGGGSPIYYQWTGPNGFTSSNKNLHNLEPGIYCVKVFDGCSEKEECFEIVDCDLVTININGNVTKTCDGYCYGSILVSASGGNSPYKYKWDNGSSNSSLSNICKGQYCVTVTDKSGCVNEKCFTVGEKDEDVTGVTNPCGWQYSCNGNPTNFVPYDGNMNCYYNDPFDCTRVNCYCLVTGGYVGGWNESYIQLDYDWNSCILWGFCPDGSGWDVAQYGSYQSWYQYVQVCHNCWQCYYIEICILNGYYQVIQAYPVGDSKCGGGGPGINGGDDDDKLSLNSPIRLNELNYLLKRDSLIDENSLLLIPEGLSDTLFLEEYTEEFAKIKDKGEHRIKVNVLSLEDEIKEIDCSLKDCSSASDGVRSKIRSFETEDNAFIESTVLPNPFNDKVTINISNFHNEEIRIDVTSVLGQSMISRSFNQKSLQIESGHWHSGVYICVIRKNGEIIGTHKIIKQ